MPLPSSPDDVAVRLGYARVSTSDQNLDLQIHALEEAGCHAIWTDKGVSGTTMKRPEFEACLKALQPGNLLVVWKLDRLGRKLSGLASLYDDLAARGVGIVSLSEGIDTRTQMGKVMMQMAGIFAEVEHELILERTRAGLEAARRKGNKGGRPRKINPLLLRDIVRDRESINPETGRRWTVSALARKYGVSVATISRVLTAENERSSNDS